MRSNAISWRRASGLFWCSVSAVPIALTGLAHPAGAGGLPVPCAAGTCGTSGPSKWLGSGAATATQSGTTLAINQTSANAVLNWQSFNIAAGSKVNFLQPNASALALNNIFQADPSQVLGSLSANGRVYLINQNGILFGAGSQVNVAGLVASTLNITPNAVASGIASTTGGTLSTPSFVPFQSAGTALPSGAISVAPGASLNAPGGQIFLFAPQITNQGTINTPDGQTILAAGNSVYLAASTDSNLRGLVVAVDGGGTVTNGASTNAGVTGPAQLVGQIVAQRGNVTLMGLAVNQDGLVSANTSVRANGSILLIAADRSKGGALNLGKQSVTSAGLDLTDTSVAVDATAQPKSSVDLQGVDVFAASGATVTATSGSITVTGSSASVQQSNFNSPPVSATSDGSRIYLEPGSSLDASGATVVLPMSSNALQVQLRGSELANDPLQRNGALRGQTVTVDVRQYGTNADGSIWQGTPLANLSGDLATIQRGIAERNETGGTVTLQSTGDVIVAAGATVNVSGGGGNIQAGYLNTSSVIGTNGQLYNIANASPNMSYSGVANTTSLSVTDSRWGVTNQYSGIYGTGQGQYQPGYVQGADAGALNLDAPHIAFDGSLSANVQVGPNQRKPPAALSPGALERPYDQLPLSAALDIGLANPTSVPTLDFIVDSVEIAPGVVLPGLKNSDGSAFNPLTDPWPANGSPTLISPSLIGANAAGRVSIAANSTISLPAGVDLQLPPGGSFSAVGSSVEIGGAIDGAGASVGLQSLTTVGGGLNGTGYPAVGITLLPNAQINVAGSWVNDNPAVAAQSATAPLTINGGSVALVAGGGTLNLFPGGLIDVSGGAQFNVSGALTAGKAGSISVSAISPDPATPTNLALGAQLRGYGVSNGGSLTLSAASFCITSGTSCADSLPGVLTLAPSEFDRGGFSSYALGANVGGLELAPGTQLHPVQQNFMLGSALLSEPSAPSLANVAAIGSLPAIERQPVNLALSAQYALSLNAILTPSSFASAPQLSLDTGSGIVLAPKAALTLTSNTRIVDDATVSAPSGTVSMTVNANLPEPAYIPGQQVWLGPNATIDVGGVVQSVADDQGHILGTVLPGGVVKLTALRGAVETMPGSLIDVAGTAAILDVPTVNSAGVSSFQSSRVASAGGSVNITAAESAVLGGTMEAHSGSPTTVPNGGFSLVLDGNQRYFGGNTSSAPAYPFDPRSINVVTAQAPVIIAAKSDLPMSLDGQSTVATDMLAAAGFDAVHLGAVSFDGVANLSPTVAGQIQFDGNVALSAGRSLTLDAASVLSTGGMATLTAPYLSLGQSRISTQQILGSTAPGNGTLQANAAAIDLIGHIGFGGFSNVTLNSSGDIRAIGVSVPTPPGVPLNPQFYGGFTVPGSLQLTAQQIYPSTLTSYIFSTASGGTGSINISAAHGAATSPLLSAGGALIFNAAQITQGGVLRAPLGTIAMNAADISLAPGSTTSTSADGLVIPFGVTQGGFDWVYPVGGTQALVYGVDGIALPSQSIQLTGASVNISKGATLDVKGGGDLLANEFIPGPTGTVDVLGNTRSFAILPASGLMLSPYDPYYSGGSGVVPGQSVYLSGGGGVPAGTYAVLPVRYALLPGAYYVTPVAGYQDLSPGQQIAQPDGSVVVSGAGAFAGTGLTSSRTSGFDIQPGQAVQNLAQYTLTTANAFFGNQAHSAGVIATPLPQDSGHIALNAITQLVLDGTLEAAPGTNGRGAELDISSAAIRLVNGNAPPAAAANTLDVDANALGALGAGSILLGGSRTQTNAGVRINTQASTVEVTTGATIAAPEILLSATNSVTVDGGATVGSSGALSAIEPAVLLSGDGALLRVAASAAPTITRTGSVAAQGQVTLQSGSLINAAAGSLGIDVSTSTTLDGTLNLTGGSLWLSGGLISVGVAPANTPGIVLPGADLGNLSLANLSLISRGSVDFYDGASISSDNIALSAGALRGFAHSDVRVSAINALTLSGSASSAGLAGSGTGTSALSLSGASVELQQGALDISGFSTTSLTSAGLMNISGNGALSIEGNINVQAGLLSADSGAQRTIGATGVFSYSTAPSTATIQSAKELPLGADLSVSASAISFDGSAQFHSGALSLTATGLGGDVSLGSGAIIDLTGVNTVFGTTSVPSRGGTLSLQSQGGAVSAASGSIINVSAVDAVAADAGSLRVQAANGAADLNGQLLGKNADVAVDAQSFVNTPALLGNLVAGGFTGDWTLRLRGPGSFVVGSGAANAISSRSISLTADQGGIDVEGTIASSGPAGGSISLAALNDVVVNGTLDARPQRTRDMNGQVTLGTEQGHVLIGNTATIEAFDPTVPIQSASDGGLWVRAPQSSLATGSGLALGGNLRNLSSISIEGFQTFNNTSGLLGAADVAPTMANPLYASAANFMATAPALLQSLGVTDGPTPQIVPGIEIDSNQSLTLQANWALDGWRFGGQVGVLTLRSADNLNIDASLSDGFAGTTGAGAYVLSAATPSWSYRLAAGADLNSANPLAVQSLYSTAAGSGSLTVAAGANARGAPAMTMIRTGTGNIAIAAARDVTLTNSDSVIYTAGIADSGVSYKLRGQLGGLLYPTHGGSISISAGEDIVGASTPDLVTNWLWRVGTDTLPRAVSTAWTVNFADFEQGVGALGGGNISISAGGNVWDLAVSVPTIGRQVGSATPTGSVVQQLNQGDISIRAGGDIGGGSVYEGSGSALLVAGNQITQSPTVAGLYPMVLLGDATATLSARDGATLAGVANPTLLPQGTAQGAGTNQSFFSTYGSTSAVNLQSLAGTVELVNSTDPNNGVIANYTTLAFVSNATSNSYDQSGYSALNIYPGKLAATSLRGGMNIDNTLALFPDANGSVNLLAHDTIQLGSAGGSGFELIESNADPALLPSVANPQGSYQLLSDQLASIPAAVGVVQNAAVPVHLSGSTPDSSVSQINSLTGDVAFIKGQSSQLYFAAPADIFAGRDVTNLSVDFTNLKSTDVSAIVAGRDITYALSREAQGQFSIVPTFINVDGPGSLELIAGRDVNLGTSDGITSRGNLDNSGLSGGGAQIGVLAGVGTPTDQSYSTFVMDYLASSSAYSAELVGYMQSLLGGSPTSAQALSAFEALPTLEQAPLIQSVFFDELRAAGRSAAAPGPLSGNFTRGFDAIQALFPGGTGSASVAANAYAGDISLYFSRIYTLAGGDINLMAPGGLIDVGLASPPTAFGIDKAPSQLGIVAQSTGSVSAYSFGNFEVNESRVFAADGGNILIWSTRGNIDAGRGAKTAISAPAPTISFVNGVPTVTFPAALTGSGIQTLATTPDVPPGDVDLFAPNGVVNANDAGIVAGNLTIAATAVLGTNNIKVSGLSVGVPVEAGGLGASLAGVSAVGSSASQAAAGSVDQNPGRQNSAPLADAALGWLDVFVEGFGADVCKPDDLECLKRQTGH